MLLRKALVALGLAKAPAPVRMYAALGGSVGLVPLLGFFAWQNRARIAELVRRAQTRAPSIGGVRAPRVSGVNGQGYVATGL